MESRDDRTSFRRAYQESVESGKRALSARNCFAPEGECAGKIVQAHTISKCHGLRRISKNGEVYQAKINPFAKGFEDLTRMQRRGISAVSTFGGFCSKHDAEIFDPIENHPFSMSREQVFLLMFRTIAKEMFLKRVQLGEIAGLKRLEAVRLGVTEKHVKATSLGESFENGVELGVQELVIDKARMDKMLIEKDFSDIECCVIRCGRTPNLVCSGYYSPFYDFNGNRLQPAAIRNEKLNSLYCNVIALDRGGWIILAFFKDESDGPLQLVNTLLSTGQVDAASAWLSLVHFENAAYQMDWWDALPETFQNDVLTTFRDVANPLSPVENQLRRFITQGFVNWEPGPPKWIR